MKAIAVIGFNTFREIIRDRILYVLVLFALLLIGLSILLGNLSFAEQVRISVDLGLMGMHLSAVFLSIFVGSALVHKEMEKRTIMTLLARPLPRGSFLLGKLLGMGLVVVTVLLGILFVQVLVMVMINAPLEMNLLAAIGGIVVESLLLLAIVVFFGTFTKPILAAALTLGTFVIGHWIPDLIFFKEKSESSAFKTFAEIVINTFPNLERFNWRSAVTYNDLVPFSQWGTAIAYGVAWIGVFCVLSTLIFRRRDLG